ncbi:MAG: hypothetical protein KGJ86_20925, partial [Chloroflexota bacterium]|nr:hypothetical protein [Chloroflexota bacterium]
GNTCKRAPATTPERREGTAHPGRTFSLIIEGRADIFADHKADIFADRRQGLDKELFVVSDPVRP